MQNDYEVRRIVERARIELVYARSSLRQFLTLSDPGRPTEEEETRINSVGALISKLSDTIKEADNLLTKIK
jgi:hypothetical protein